jgi:hypothetical protein
MRNRLPIAFQSHDAAAGAKTATYLCRCGVRQHVSASDSALFTSSGSSTVFECVCGHRASFPRATLTAMIQTSGIISGGQAAPPRLPIAASPAPRPVSRPAAAPSPVPAPTLAPDTWRAKYEQAVRESSWDIEYYKERAENEALMQRLRDMGSQNGNGRH